MLTHYPKSPCCQPVNREQTSLFPTSFLAASYFLALILSFSGFVTLLEPARSSGNSTLLFSLGLWGINLVTYCVVSFLYFSEQDNKLKLLFGYLREGLMYGYMVSLWWPLSLLAASSEWPLVLGICSAISLVWLRTYCGCAAESVFKAQLFLMAALCAYLGLTMQQQAQSPGGFCMIFAATTLFLAFVLDSWFKDEAIYSNNDKQVLQQLLYMLSLLAQYGTIHMVIVS